MVADLRMSDNGWSNPIGNRACRKEPLYNFAGFLGGNQAAQHIPTVLGGVTTIEEQEFAIGCLDRHAASRIFRGKHNCFAFGNRLWLDCTCCGCCHWPTRIAWKDTALAIYQIRFPKVG